MIISGSLDEIKEHFLLTMRCGNCCYQTAGFTVPSFMAMVQFSACPSISSGI